MLSDELGVSDFSRLALSIQHSEGRIAGVAIMKHMVHEYGKRKESMTRRSITCSEALVFGSWIFDIFIRM